MHYLEDRPKLAWSLILLYAGLIFFISSIPNPPQPIILEDLLFWLLTSLEHVAEYIVLGGLLYTGFRSLDIKTAERALLLAVLFSAAYGASDEIHQYFVPNRYCDIKDLLADTTGGLIGAFTLKHRGE